MKILVTGANGFIGKNLCAAIESIKEFQLFRLERGNASQLDELVNQSDLVIHLAGENRPKDVADFTNSNVDLTEKICNLIAKSGREIPVIFSSSTQATLNNPYGESKKKAEEILRALSDQYKIPVCIYRLPGIFGKWAKPNYNSVVATFCSNIANDLPIRIDAPSFEIEIAYIDDVVLEILNLVNVGFNGYQLTDLSTTYLVTLEFLAESIYKFKNSRLNLISEAVGTGFLRALYSTYLSYLPPENFTYKIPAYTDPRGVFVEVFKTRSYGQFSYFTSLPGVIRGGHYHHTKVEKFLVVKGEATFKFRNISTGEIFQISTGEKDGVIVETIPGWSHEIINTCEEEIIVMLWASELFDRSKPDTYPFKV